MSGVRHSQQQWKYDRQMGVLWLTSGKRCPPGPFPSLEFTNAAPGSYGDGLLPIPMTVLTPIHISVAIPTLPRHAPLNGSVHPFASES